MPAYSNATPPYSIAQGDSVQVWNAEQPAAGGGGASASMRVALTPQPGRKGFSVNGFFSAAPGVFEIDVQVSDVDNDAQYQTISGGNITTVDGTNNTFHLDAPGVTALFARLLMRSRANAVNVTADFTS